MDDVSVEVTLCAETSTPSERVVCSAANIVNHLHTLINPKGKNACFLVKKVSLIQFPLLQLFYVMRHYSFLLFLYVQNQTD